MSEANEKRSAKFRSKSAKRRLRDYFKSTESTAERRKRLTYRRALPFGLKLSMLFGSLFSNK